MKKEKKSVGSRKEFYETYRYKRLEGSVERIIDILDEKEYFCIEITRRASSIGVDKFKFLEVLEENGYKIYGGEMYLLPNKIGVYRDYGGVKSVIKRSDYSRELLKVNKSLVEFIEVFLDRLAIKLKFYEALEPVDTIAL